MSTGGPHLDGQVAVVTGGARGLGYEIATALRAAGAQVVLCARDADQAAAAARRLDPSGCNAAGVACDIRDEAAVVALATAAVSRFGRIDVLVSNSGIAGPTAALWETPAADWRETIETNLTGTFLCCRAVMPVMMRQQGGSIIIVGSMTGKRPLYGRVGYAASKAALIGFTRTLAVEAGPHGVRVNLVSPGPLEGDRMQRVFDAQAAARGVPAERVRAEMLAESPLARLVPPADVASVVTFLAADTAASITGADINVSAGLVMH